MVLCRNDCLPKTGSSALLWALQWQFKRLQSTMPTTKSLSCYPSMVVTSNTTEDSWTIDDATGAWNDLSFFMTLVACNPFVLKLYRHWAFVFLAGQLCTYDVLFTAAICFDIKMISKESILVYMRQMYIFLEFWRLCTCPSDPPGAVASMHNRGRNVASVGVGW